MVPAARDLQFLQSEPCFTRSWHKHELAEYVHHVLLRRQCPWTWSISLRKLRFAKLLPALQVSVAAALDVWGSQESGHVGLDTLYIPTADLVCRGINAPAWLFEGILTKIIPIYRLDKPPLSVFGVGIDEYLFLILIIVLWYLVGRNVDRLRSANRTAEGWIGGGFFNLVAGVVGIALLILGVLRISKPADFNNLRGNLLQGGMFLLWGTVLTFAAFFSIAREFRRRRSGVHCHL